MAVFSVPPATYVASNVVKSFSTVLFDIHQRPNKIFYTDYPSGANRRDMTLILHHPDIRIKIP